MYAPKLVINLKNKSKAHKNINHRRENISGKRIINVEITDGGGEQYDEKTFNIYPELPPGP